VLTDQKGKTYLDFTEARDSEWQWHQLGHVQVCTLLQTDNHASIGVTSYGALGHVPPLELGHVKKFGSFYDNNKH